VLKVVTDCEFFRGSNFDMLNCSRDAKLAGRKESLLSDLGVEGAVVDVRVDRDVLDAEGVRGVDRERNDGDMSGVVGFLRDERSGGGSSCITADGAESLLRCVGRLGCKEDETL